MEKLIGYVLQNPIGVACGIIGIYLILDLIIGLIRKK